MIGFVSLVSALAWPVASFSIAVLLRRELRQALGRLGQVKYGGMEVNFREEIRQAESLARAIGRAEPVPGSALPAPVVHESAEGDATEIPGALIGRENSLGSTVLVGVGARPDARAAHPPDVLFKLCHDSPRLAILEAWDELGQAAIRAATVRGDRRSAAPVRGESAVRFLVDRGWLNGAQGQLVDRLRQLVGPVERGDGPPPTPDDARRYVELILPLLGRVGSLT